MNELWYNAKFQAFKDIDDALVAKMRSQIKPLLMGDDHWYRIVELPDNVDSRTVAYTWIADKHLGRRIEFMGLDKIDIMTFHKWGAPSLFKPSLAEVFACINQFVPDWSGVRYFWLDCGDLSAFNVIGDYHFCRCRLFGEGLLALEQTA